MAIAHGAHSNASPNPFLLVRDPVEGLEAETPEEFADMVYGVKFHYSGGPGYNGDLFILHGDAMGEPMTLIRRDGELVVV